MAPCQAGGRYEKETGKKKKKVEEDLACCVEIARGEIFGFQGRSLGTAGSFVCILSGSWQQFSTQISLPCMSLL